MNENGKLDQQDIECIDNHQAYNYDFSSHTDPKGEDDDWWKFCYYNIIGDVNIDGNTDTSDRDCVLLYLNGDSIETVIIKYDANIGIHWTEEMF